MAKRKTHEEFVKEVKDKYGDEYTVLEKYVKSDIKILVKHNCGYKWKIKPSNLLIGRGCPICGKGKSGKKRTKTHEEFVEQLNKVHGEGGYIPLENYKGANTKILVRHKCGYEWQVQPYSLLNNGCPKCGGTKKKTHEEFIQEIKEKYGDEYEVLGEYVNVHTKILIRHNCEKCNYYKWETTPNSLLRGRVCPVCGGKVAKLGINTIWDTDRWMCDLGVSESDTKKYSRCSNKKITVKCPDCGREKKVTIYQVYTNKSISCICGDGKSYPEKFIFNLLEQLGVDFETEYSPKWIKPKRYDFHIKDNNCIIETHGEQHYDISFKNIGSRTLEEEQQNDKFKKEVALKNGIKHYIELDCRESNIDWVKNSVLNSKLNKLFDLSNIDWKQCDEFANKNIIKEVCEYWNNKKENEVTTNLMKKFKLSRDAIIEYLKKGTKLSWCNYDPKEEMKKSSSRNGKAKSKKVKIFKDNKSLGIFPSCAELSRQSEKLFGVKLNGGNISSNCNNKVTQYKGFIFKYVEEDK
ncbi:hypothetical protein AM596_15000 [Clostridium perfringens CP4]|uniref:hypothetical protein n=1 Tax=Clostridium perfringens TaxID=1502 RepID=UPI0007073CD3|nr:hypothetical protein [Clostridium perfringens]KQC91342.1 hypothetical protein AM596_15000 [Clostridium perfringens CP4]